MGYLVAVRLDDSSWGLWALEISELNEDERRCQMRHPNFIFLLIDQGSQTEEIIS